MSTLPIIYLIQEARDVFFGQIVIYLSIYLIILQLFTYMYFSKDIYSHSTNNKITKYFQFSTILNKKYLILIFFTLIPIFRFSIGNSQIFGVYEILGIIGILFILSFLYIGVVSNILSNLLNNSYFVLIPTSVLIIVYELPTITNSFNLNHINWAGYAIFTFIFLIVFLMSLLKNSTRRFSLIFIVFLVIGTSNQILGLFNKTENIDLETLQNDSPFYSLLSNNIERKYSVVILTYDGYPQNETLQNYGIDNSNQTEYLIENGFTIFNGTYSIGSYSLGTMARLLEGSALRINENNSRTIVGGFSSFVKSLDNQGYETVGVFPSSFYFPPNTKSNYNYYFPNKAQRSAKTAKSILSGNLTHEDAIYTIPYKDYLEEKNQILSTIGTTQNPYFLYTHTYFPGHTQNSGACLPGEFEQWKDRLEYANVEMKNDLSLLKSNYENTIIIVMGDHGPFLTKNCTSLTKYEASEITRLDLQDRHGTFLAIRFPKNTVKPEVNDINLIQNTLIKVASILSGNFESYKKYSLPSNTPIDRTHLPKEINIIDNRIVNGVDNNKPLFEDVSTSSSR